MTLRWRICFSFCLTASWLCAATVTGRVELLDSREASVRKKKDYSGVVISLVPMGVTAAVPPRRARIVQQNKTFVPHLVAIPAGSTIDFPNMDPIFHNVFSNYSGQIFDLSLYPPNSTRSVKFIREGVVRVFCNIHASMSAVIVVVNTPYAGVSRADGLFTIPDVPQGIYTLNVFHERALPESMNAVSRRVQIGSESVTLPVIGVSENGFLAGPHKNKFGKDYGPEPADAAYPGVKK